MIQLLRLTLDYQVHLAYLSRCKAQYERGSYAENKFGGGVLQSGKTLAVSLCFAVAALAFALCMPNAAYADVASGKFEVSTSDEFADAVKAINAADSGSYTIELAKDIRLSGDNKLTKNTTTILGEGHVLSGGDNVTISVGGNAVLSLGKDGYSGALTFDNSGNTVITICLIDNSKLEMHSGVTIQNSAPLGAEGGVQLNGNATFDMFGGTIKNCKDQFGITAGGVGVGSGDSDKSSDACTFNFYDGSIVDCSGGYGAGVRVGKDGTFIMSGGSISGCEASAWGGGIYAEQAKKVEISGGSINGNTAKYGGGIAVSYMKYSPTSFFPRKLIISGGKITNNTASSYGGAIMVYNASTAQAVSSCSITDNKAQYGGGIMEQGNSSIDLTGGGVSFCNNIASSGGSDAFVNKSEDSIKLPSAVGMGASYRDSGKAIDGWYSDNPSYTPSANAEPVDVSGTLKGQLALVASYALQPEPATATITATKKLTGATLEADQFLYELKDSEDNVVATTRNKADGSISFDALSFDTEGTYKYTISEVNEGKEGIAYDTNTYTATVTVTKNADGTAYVAEISYGTETNEVPVFESTYTPVKPNPGTDPDNGGNDNNGGSDNGDNDNSNGDTGKDTDKGDNGETNGADPSDNSTADDEDASGASDDGADSDEEGSTLPETSDASTVIAGGCIAVLLVALAAAIVSFCRCRR